MTSLPKKENGNYDWIEYRKLVLSDISTLKVDVKEIKGEQIKIKLDLRELKTRATIWGGVGGFIVGLIVAIIGWVL